MPSTSQASHQVSASCQRVSTSSTILGGFCLISSSRSGQLFRRDHAPARFAGEIGQSRHLIGIGGGITQLDVLVHHFEIGDADPSGWPAAVGGPPL